MTEPKYELSWQEITPDLAREWLTRVPAHQRRRMAAYAEELATKLRAGTLRDSPQPIIFDEAGNVLDGQHRLYACALSGVSFRAVIVGNVPSSMFDVIDTGRKRLAAQFITGKYGETLSSAARLTLTYAATGGTMLDISQPFSISEIMEEVARRPEFDKYATQVRRARGNAKIPGGSLLAITALGSPVGEWIVIDWLDGLSTGADLSRGDPRLALREIFATSPRGLTLRERGGSNTYVRRRIWGLIVKAWNAHVQETSVKLLRFRPADKRNPGEDMPLIVGAPVYPVPDGPA